MAHWPSPCCVVFIAISPLFYDSRSHVRRCVGATRCNDKSDLSSSFSCRLSGVAEKCTHVVGKQTIDSNTITRSPIGGGMIHLRLFVPTSQNHNPIDPSVMPGSGINSPFRTFRELTEAKDNVAAAVKHTVPKEAVVFSTSSAALFFSDC